MVLSRSTLTKLNSNEFAMPADHVFDLPEKVLQFGTGVLLRGLVDFYIDKANRQGIFNGRVVMVKSTQHGETTSYGNQNGLYNICLRGFSNGQVREENIICFENFSIILLIFA